MTLLDDMGIHVAIRSYKRAGRVTTLKVVPFATVWVPESQGEDYRRLYPQVVTIPDDEDGNLARKNNAILNRTPCKWTLMLDDDITRIGCWDGGPRHWLNAEEVEWLIAVGFTLAAELGVTFWGIQQNSDEMLYKTYQPFNLLAPILGPFHGHLSPTIRYDESVLGKDDYDYWLQTILKERRTLRLNKYHYRHDGGGEPGGFVSQRTIDIEQAGVKRMREKWGSKVFKMGGSAGGKSATGKNILNSMVRIPIEGC